MESIRFESSLHCTFDVMLDLHVYDVSRITRRTQHATVLHNIDLHTQVTSIFEKQYHKYQRSGKWWSAPKKHTLKRTSVKAWHEDLLLLLCTDERWKWLVVPLTPGSSDENFGHTLFRRTLSRPSKSAWISSSPFPSLYENARCSGVWCVGDPRSCHFSSLVDDT